jgi:hypothetical protein
MGWNEMKLINYAVIALSILIMFSGCQKSEKELYPIKSFESNPDWLNPALELMNPHLSLQTIKDWVPIQDTLAVRDFNKISVSATIKICALYYLPDENCVNVIGFLPAKADEKMQRAKQYLDDMSAQCDTVFSRDRFTRNDIRFDQLVARKNGFIFTQLIGHTDSLRDLVTFTYVIPENMYDSRKTQVEASLASIKLSKQ